MKIKVTKKLLSRWEVAKAKYNRQGHSWDDIKSPLIGRLWWVNPKEVLWLYATNNEEDYEGHQTQIGVKKDGTVVWAFYSHCSCSGYSDSDCPGEVTDFVNTEETYKQYEMEEVDKDVLNLIKKRLAAISAELE